MDEVEYYNTYIDYMNDLSRDLDSALMDYYSYVPETVTTETEIYFYGAEYSIAKADLDNARNVLFGSSMTIADSDKQDAVEASTTIYFDAFDEFLEIYQEAGDYYRNGVYKDDASYAPTLEEGINAAYDTVILAQYDLSIIINEYQEEARGELNEDTDDPLEKIGVSVTLLTEKAGQIVDVLGFWEFANPDVEGVTALYDELLAKHEEEASEVDALYDDYYADVFAVFDESYLTALTVFEEEVGVFVEDAKNGEVTEESSIKYDPIFTSYEYLVDMHNLTVDTLNWYY